MKPWCPLSVSNRRPPAYKADALPAELKGLNECLQNTPDNVLGVNAGGSVLVVHGDGVEPSTHGFSGRRSTD